MQIVMLVNAKKTDCMEQAPWKIFGKLLGLSKFVTVKNCLQAAPLHPPTPADKLQKELIRRDSIWSLAVKKE